MKRAILLGATGFAVAVAMLAGGFLAGQPGAALAGDTPAATTTPRPIRSTARTVETIVREYLLAHPEVLLEVQQALDAKQKEEQKVAQRRSSTAPRTRSTSRRMTASSAIPNGKVTIVEFFDYNCGYCKRAVEDMQALTAADPDLRFVLKEFPILGPESQKASVVSMAFHNLMPEKYSEFHNQLLGGHGRAGEANAIKIAVSLGADEAKLREAMKDPKITEIFNETYDLANKLAITGTPSYVIGNEVVFGAQGRDVLNEKLAVVKAACATAAC